MVLPKRNLAFSSFSNGDSDKSIEPFVGYICSRLHQEFWVLQASDPPARLSANPKANIVLNARFAW